jgi:Mrp family chromosome partitioning ATPase
VVDGRELRNGPLRALRERIRALLTTGGEREEAELEARLRDAATLTRTNVVAMVSPKGGVGKTTTTFLVGNLLAGHLKLRVLAVDANPDFGTLARLPPDKARTARSLADLLDDLDLVHTAAELRPYVSRLPTGLHLLGAPRDAEVMARITPADYANCSSSSPSGTRSSCSTSAPGWPASSRSGRSGAPTRRCWSPRRSG